MSHIATWGISFLSIAGVIIRPFKIPEAIWAVSGAGLLVILHLLLPMEGLLGIAKGTDVYLFLTGMMLLAETAREEKLFDWLAVYATKMANGSSQKLFLLVYVVGIIVTTFLSNDATAVVLTPAVAAAARAAKVRNPLPYLLLCAFVANAASFILPISNPANLVIYGSHMPPLLQWLPQYIMPSLAAVLATFLLLRFTQRKALVQQIATEIAVPTLTKGGLTAMWGIILTAAVLLVSSALNLQLGLSTCIAGIVISLIVLMMSKKNPRTLIKGVSWSVIPLVAGLFIIVEALNKTGVIENITNILTRRLSESVNVTAWSSGIIIAVVCNLVNNLPAGLIAGNVVHATHLPDFIKRVILIGVDLGPNLSITGSLATILWLVALRREGLQVSAWSFLKLGVLVMTVALFFAIAAVWI
jgi:arsenical pump membrane protein